LKKKKPNKFNWFGLDLEVHLIVNLVFIPLEIEIKF